MMPRQTVLGLWLLLLPVQVPAHLLPMLNNPLEVMDGDVRLVGSAQASEGRVEIYHDGLWGTVCDDGWDLLDANVVCRQLNFPGAKSVFTRNNYGKATGPIWLEEVRCEGSEPNLLACGLQEWGVTDCTHKEDVAIACEASQGALNESLHWVDHSIHLSSQLGELFDSQALCDVSIVAQSPTGDRNSDGSFQMLSETVCVHKSILWNYPALRLGDGKSKLVVNISHSCQTYFTSFFRYLYTGKVELSYSSAQCYHWLASKFQVKPLMEASSRLFSGLLTEDSSFHSQLALYNYGVDTNDLALQENCLRYLAWNIEDLINSPAWPSVSPEVIKSLLLRSDLVLKNEYSLLQSVERWILASNSSLEEQADLLNHIRFPVIPVEMLYKLELNNTVYETHKDVYRSKMLKALNFNVLNISSLESNPRFDKNDVDYHFRHYIEHPWGKMMRSSYGDSYGGSYGDSYGGSYGGSHVRHYNNQYGGGHRQQNYYPELLTCPAHSTIIQKNNQVRWNMNYLTKQHQCSNMGLTCDSVPVAVFKSQTRNRDFVYHNRMLVYCDSRFVSHVQEFKDGLAYWPGNSSLTYPCPSHQFTMRFVLRPFYA